MMTLSRRCRAGEGRGSSPREMEDSSKTAPSGNHPAAEREEGAGVQFHIIVTRFGGLICIVYTTVILFKLCSFHG